MIVASRHVDSLEKLKQAEILDMTKTLVKVKSILRKILRPDGFNIGLNIGKAAGAGVNKHIHIHIVPRWVGDTNFMPVLGSTKMISQSLSDLFTKIKKRKF